MRILFHPKSFLLFCACSLTIASLCSTAKGLQGDDLDWDLQGEYLGSISEYPDHKVAAQIIARGEGEFGLVAFDGGLPGAGGEAEALEGSPQNPAIGKLEGSEVIFRAEDNAEAVLADGKLVIYHGAGDERMEVAVLEKVTRESPTLGAAPPEGAFVLFDGSSADQFENGELEGDLLKATNCFSKRTLGDHQLHIEFRTPFMPKARGQARGNSGVYVQGRYEVQVLDSFGLEGLDNECGGIYSIARPDVNACFPPMSWQSYDIDFTAARYDASGDKTAHAKITVRLNGIVIHDDIELPHHTPGRHQEGPENDSLFLQDHGNAVVFRNIWVVEK